MGSLTQRVVFNSEKTHTTTYGSLHFLLVAAPVCARLRALLASSQLAHALKPAVACAATGGIPAIVLRLRRSHAAARRAHRQLLATPQWPCVITFCLTR